MASKSVQAEAHRIRQELRAFAVPVCDEFARTGNAHGQDCVNRRDQEDVKRDAQAKAR